MVGVGNALSLYWNARGLARLAGVAFTAAGAPGAGHFIRHLPRAAPPPPRGNATALAAACGACPPREVRAWRYPHTCLSAWAHIRGEVQRDTHSALRASGAERKALARLRSSDVAVHLRCLPAFNANYPLAAFSLYADLPRPWRDARRLRFLILGGKLGPACTQVAAALEGYLQRRFPQARVLRQFNTTDKAHEEDLLGPGAEDAAEADFATMVHAPVLVRAPGSFSLWAGLARRRGVVLSAANPLVSTWDWWRADFGRDWSWSTAPLLTPEVVERHGFDFHRPEPWIGWLCSH
ncbi:unnamed protein product [Prorocentrum cordatum]|uniref:Uncharacterized protein n=1 Tax=Prorocentrum cordatum TaxID=2364126 RepID=A0ABN9XME3_9DINO|nr:unnamed protein product [Polarella glacialis]